MIKLFCLLFILLPVLILILDSCESQRTELLVNQHCGSCHLVPAPSLLDKKTWMYGVLPEMAFRMGFKNPNYKLLIPAGDSAAVYGTIPVKPTLTDEEWDAIREYYIVNAPDSLDRIERKINTTLSLFEVKPVRILGNNMPFVTLVKTDTIKNKIFVGANSVLYQFGKGLVIEDSFQLKSPSSNLFIEKDQITLSMMGILEPNERTTGELGTLSINHKVVPVIDSLQRPVYFEIVDLNNDRLEDYLICEFGNYTGALVAYENLGHGKFKAHVVYGLPGTLKVVIRDTNHDQWMDIVLLAAQGNEQIALLTNQGNFHFAISPLLRFPPVYGSSYFELVDFNKDGHFDILYTNGDNADFSNILKPYHGIRIFMNDGNNKFTESWFYPMYGATKAIAHDFDQDGDLDIASISFFPDFDRHPEEGFLYFENVGNQFTPYSVSASSSGRWLVMDASDIDKDGDYDLVLGAYNMNFFVPPRLLDQWSKKDISLLVLINTVSQN